MIDASTNDLEVLRLMLEWGADEALLDSPVDRFKREPVAIATAAVTPARPATPHIAPLVAGPALARQAAEAATDLAGLHAAMDAFSTCPLRATASHTIAPSGNPAAGLVFIYDTPGSDDDRAGVAFSGAAGERLDRVLGSAGLSRTHFLVAPLLPWRPPGGRPASETELALCLPFVHRLLALVRPRRLVLLGAGPYRALSGDEGGFRKARGKWAPLTVPGLYTHVQALPMLSAELWLTSAANRQATWADLMQLITTVQDA